MTDFTAAACRRTATQVFFSSRPTDIRRAKEYCDKCELRAPCLALGLEQLQADDYGIYGGTTPTERRGMRTNSGPRPQHGGVKPQPIRHGTVSGYTVHIKRRIPMCDECAAARAEYRQQYKARKRAERNVA